MEYISAPSACGLGLGNIFHISSYLGDILYLYFTLQNLFTRASLQKKVEDFLYDLFNEKFKKNNDRNNPD